MFKIYVSTYAKYSAGSIEGKWFDLSDYPCKDDFIEACQEFHSDETDWEFHFQDWEDIPACFISESYIDAEFWTYMDYEDGHQGEAKVAFCAMAGKWDESTFEDAFRGQFDTEQDYAENLVEELGMLDSMPENLRWYFDYEKFARDLFISDVTMENGFVFDLNY